MVHSKYILLVDDDADDQYLFAEALNSLNRDIGLYKAFTAQEALLQLNSTNQPPDAVFLDLNMPVYNGIELLATIKQSQSLNNIPVIIYSTSDAPEHKRKTTALGAAHYMVKHNSFNDLCRELGMVLTSRLR